MSHSTLPWVPASFRELPRVCLIGAGSSGITAAKALHERGIPFDCFEKSDRVGGLWVFENKNGVGSAYRDLCINVSKPRMQYSDYPMPDSYPDFCHHSYLAQYFSDYVDHFGFRDKIVFDTCVERTTRLEDGTWEIELGGGETRYYDALLVANGHHWNPRWPEPEIPGSDSFTGVQLHSHYYREKSMFAGKRVVVVGMGNSAMDIVVESSYIAESTHLVARRGAWIIPKYMFGKPWDQWPDHPQLPFELRRALKQRILETYVGDPERYGLPKPQHKLASAHDCISSRIFDRIAHGAVKVKPEITSFDGSTVHYADGSTTEADIVVWCTGYKITFPFFDEGFISAPDNHIELYRRAFHPDIPNLVFICLLQPLGATMPLAEAQGAWAGEYLTGRYVLPSPQEMRAHIAADQEHMRNRYVRSRRHTIQVDVKDYLYRLAKERKAGAKRARERDFELSVKPRAQTLAGVS